MMSKISRLFDSLRETSSQAPEKYQLGEVPMFAGRTHHRNSTLIVIISLYCAVCVELLPKLKSVADVFDGEIVLVTDGDVNEAQAIQQHFDFSFNVLSASAEEFHNVYRPEITPYAYVLNADRTIAYMGHVGEVPTIKGTIAQLGLMPVVEEVSRS